MLRILHDTKYDFIKYWKTAGDRHDRVHRARLRAARRPRGAAHGEALNYSIEFTGGTVVQLHFAQAASRRRRPRRGRRGRLPRLRGHDVRRRRTNYMVKVPPKAGEAAAANADSVGAQIVDVAQAAAARRTRRTVAQARVGRRRASAPS